MTLAGYSQRTSVEGMSGSSVLLTGASSSSISQEGQATKSAGRHEAADNKVWTDVDVNKVAVDVAV
jgi:hypothetical protein